MPDVGRSDVWKLSQEIVVSHALCERQRKIGYNDRSEEDKKIILETKRIWTREGRNSPLMRY